MNITCPHCSKEFTIEVQQARAAKARWQKADRGGKPTPEPKAEPKRADVEPSKTLPGYGNDAAKPSPY